MSEWLSSLKLKFTLGFERWECFCSLPDIELVISEGPCRPPGVYILKRKYRGMKGFIFILIKLLRILSYLLWMDANLFYKDKHSPVWVWHLPLVCDSWGPGMAPCLGDPGLIWTSSKHRPPGGGHWTSLTRCLRRLIPAQIPSQGKHQF